LKKEISLLK